MPNRARICLIDDDSFVRDAVALGLGDAGFEVITAPGAAAGIELAGRERVEAIVTDMNMPGADGAQFIPEARARWPDVAIIAISGAATFDGRATGDVARDLGADATLIKPFRARELAALVERVLAARGHPA